MYHIVYLINFTNRKPADGNSRSRLDTTITTKTAVILLLYNNIHSPKLHDVQYYVLRNGYIYR